VFRGEVPKVKADGIGEVDRSATLMKMGRVLYDAGANRPALVAALRERDLALDVARLHGYGSSAAHPPPDASDDGRYG
jgi:hypothetical protein